jgi:probable phosphoglycerate mutase
MGDLILLRHGETEWSLAGKHTGRTDVPLTPRGEAAAAALAPLLARRDIAAAFSSPAQRAVRTASLAGLTDAKPDPDLWEWDYGGYEGMTTPQIQERAPGWYLFDDGCPHGESAEQVGERVDRVIAELRAADGDAAVFGHGHCLRVLAARWLELAPREGGRFGLSTATLGELGGEHGRPAMWRWNQAMA